MVHSPSDQRFYDGLARLAKAAAPKLVKDRMTSKQAKQLQSELSGLYHDRGFLFARGGDD